MDSHQVFTTLGLLQKKPKKNRFPQWAFVLIAVVVVLIIFILLYYGII